MKTFDDAAEIYGHSENWPYRKHLELPTLKKLLHDIDNAKILDYGCGSGTYSRWLTSQNAKYVVGYDISNGMLDYAGQQEKTESENLLYTSDINNQYHQFFDIVLANHVFPYFKDLESLLAGISNIYHTLIPNGRLVASIINPNFSTIPDYYSPYGFNLVEQAPRENGSLINFSINYPPHNETFTCYYYSQEIITQLLLTAGFKSISWEKTPTAPTVPPENEELFSRYIACPHVIYFTATKLTAQ